MASVTKVNLSSYPRPSDTIALAPLTPRPLPRLIAPVLPAHLPTPPTSRVVHPAIADQYVLSTHIIPAALPRLAADVPIPSPPAFSPDKQKWNAAVDAKRDEILDLKVKHWNGELGGGGTTQFWQCLDRYVRKDAALKADGSGLTLLFTHANGFPKEIWEPALVHFLKTNAASKHPLDITEIWLWEAINHGDSAVLNAGKLSGVYDWTDNSLDILNFLQYYLPRHPDSQLLPTHLPRLSESHAYSRRQFGFQSRTFVLIGHSFGGCTGLRAALKCPALFDSLVLVDPIFHPVIPGATFHNEDNFKLLPPAIRRRSKWASREEALDLFKKSPFFSAWDPEVLRTYVKHGIQDDPDGGVSLKTSGIIEAAVFAEALSNAETWLLTKNLDPRIELRWIMPGLATNNAIPKNYLVWLRPENSSNVIIRKSAHLIPHEAPREFAQELYAFLKKKYGRRSQSRSKTKL